MKIIIGLILFFGAAAHGGGGGGGGQGGHEGHLMQHGFIIAVGDSFASHLVAGGHHSRQVEIGGELVFSSGAEREVYRSMRDAPNANEFYFLLQAQNLDLPSLRVGDVLGGHVIRMEVGKYQPKNPVIGLAKFKVTKMLLNVENPFFGTPASQVSKTCDLACECLKVCQGSHCDLCGQW